MPLCLDRAISCPLCAPQLPHAAAAAAAVAMAASRSGHGHPHGLPPGPGGPIPLPEPPAPGASGATNLNAIYLNHLLANPSALQALFSAQQVTHRPAPPCRPDDVCTARMPLPFPACLPGMHHASLPAGQHHCTKLLVINNVAVRLTFRVKVQP